MEIDYGNVRRSNSDNADVITKLLDTEKVIQMQLAMLKGMTQTDKGWIVTCAPKYSKEAIHFAETHMRRFANQCGALSNIDEDRVERLMLPFGTELRGIIIQNIQNFGIDSPDEAAILKSTIMDIGYLVLKRSDNDLERKRAYGISSVSQSHQFDTTPEQKPSWKPF